MARREVDRIEREILAAVHVVDVRPDRLQWDPGLGVAGDHAIQISHVLVAIPRLVEPYIARNSVSGEYSRLILRQFGITYHQNRCI